MILYCVRSIYLAIWTIKTNDDTPSKRWEPWIHREVAPHCELAASSWYQRWTGSHRGVLGRRSPWPLACCCRLPLWMVPPPAGSAPEPSEEPKGHACTCTYREMVNIDHRMYIHVYMCTYYGKKTLIHRKIVWEGKSTTLLYKSHGDNSRPSMAGTLMPIWQSHKGVHYNIMYKHVQIICNACMYIHVYMYYTNCKLKTELPRS